MNSIKKYGLELIIVAMFLVINTFIIVYFNGEIKAEQRLAQNSNSVTDVAKNVDNSENKEDNSETSSADTKTSEAEDKTVENTDTETSVVKEPEKKPEEPKVKQPKKKKKAKQDEYYEMIEDFYYDLCSNYFYEEDIEERVDDLEDKIPVNYPLRSGGRNIYQIMLNEMFAREGYTFKDREIQKFYKKKTWYKKIKKIKSGSADEKMKRASNKIDKNPKLKYNRDLLQNMR